MSSIHLSTCTVHAAAGHLVCFKLVAGWFGPDRSGERLGEQGIIGLVQPGQQVVFVILAEAAFDLAVGCDPDPIADVAKAV